jgi:transposase
LPQLYDRAQHRLGRSDPYGIDEGAIKALAHDLADALVKHHLWLEKAIELLAPRADCQVLRPLPRIGQPTAAAILPAIGDLGTYTHGNPLVTLAGLDLRWFESGARIRKPPKISQVGRAYLRYWLSHYALRLVAHEPPYTAYSQRHKHQSPGKGAGQRALRAVCDKTIRMI